VLPTPPKKRRKWIYKVTPCKFPCTWIISSPAVKTWHLMSMHGWHRGSCDEKVSGFLSAEDGLLLWKKLYLQVKKCIKMYFSICKFCRICDIMWYKAKRCKVYEKKMELKMQYCLSGRRFFFLLCPLNGVL
jgi:hypothetical protein